VYTETTTLVDDISLYYDNTDLDTVQDPTRRRNKILQFVNRARDEIWWYRPWPWTLTYTTLIMVAGQANVPPNFSEVGPRGGLYDAAQGRPWVQINYQEMVTLRERTVRVNDKLFAVGPNLDTGVQSIVIPNTGSSEEFKLVYRMLPLNLAYGDDIEPLPSHFGHALLLGAVARMKEEEGDPRPLWRQDFLQALSRAMMTERETSSRPGQMPMAVGRKW
jgi:hypothetical protein